MFVNTFSNFKHHKSFLPIASYWQTHKLWEEAFVGEICRINKGPPEENNYSRGSTVWFVLHGDKNPVSSKMIDYTGTVGNIQRN